MSISLASVMRRRINHYRGEVLVLKKKAEVARCLGDCHLAQRLADDLARARVAQVALEAALGEWGSENARMVKEQLEGRQA